MKATGGGTGRLILTGMMLLPVIAVLLPSCIVLVVGMAPTIVAYVMDRTRDKLLAITVGLLNFCGSFPAEIALWDDGQTYRAAVEIAGDTLYLLMAYSGAAIGAAIYLIMPSILSQYYATATQKQLRSHRRRQQVLIESWGEEVAAEADDPVSS